VTPDVVDRMVTVLTAQANALSAALGSTGPGASTISLDEARTRSESRAS
jgi:hypothetical protein